MGTLSSLFYLVHIPVPLDVSTLNRAHYRIIHGIIIPSVLPDWCTSILLDFPGGSGSKVSAYNVGDPGLIPGSGRYPGEGIGNPFQYSCLENPKDRGPWQATVHGIARVGHDLVTKPFIHSSSLEFKTCLY